MRRQCQLLEVSRASVYRRPASVSADDLRLMELIEFDLDGVEDPQAEARKMCEQLLANTVIESYRIEAA